MLSRQATAFARMALKASRGTTFLLITLFSFLVFLIITLFLLVDIFNFSFESVAFLPTLILFAAIETAASLAILWRGLRRLSVRTKDISSVVTSIIAAISLSTLLFNSYYKSRLHQRPVYEDSGIISPTQSLPPPFPEWPPPRPSTAFMLPDDFIAGKQNYGGVGKALVAVLQRAGYQEAAFFSVPGGFAVITKMERIEADGTPSQMRWTTHDSPFPSGALASFKLIFSAPEGLYRDFLFVVTDSPFPNDPNRPPDKDQVDSWSPLGFNFLPAEFSATPIQNNTHCVAYVYEFFSRGFKTTATSIDSPISVVEHLQRAGLASLMASNGSPYAP
jgi:hypothetical protein